MNNTTIIVRCVRSNEILGELNSNSNNLSLSVQSLPFDFDTKSNILNIDDYASSKYKYYIYADKLLFLSLDFIWPVESLPENYWGTEGQYRSWGTETPHELFSRPLSY